MTLSECEIAYLSTTSVICAVILLLAFIVHKLTKKIRIDRPESVRNIPI